MIGIKHPRRAARAQAAILLALIAPAPGVAHAQTTSLVQESIMSTNALRHRLTIQNGDAAGGVAVASCRVDDTNALGFVVALNRPPEGVTTQRLTAQVGGREMTLPALRSDDFLATNGDEAKSLFRFAFANGEVRFLDGNGASTRFDASGIRKDIQTFRRLCAF